MWRGVAVLGLMLPLGCDRVFQLNDVHGVAAADAIDPGCWDPLQMNHDEDGDGLMDGCDLCPADTNPMPEAGQPDGDGDGVGDSCDPHPSTAGDHLVFFDGFEVRSSQWTSFETGVAWKIANGTATQSAVATGDFILKGRMFHNPTVITYFRGQLAGTGPTPTFAGAYAAVTNEGLVPPSGMVGNMENTGTASFVQVQRPPSNLGKDFVAKQITPAGTRARIAVSAVGECLGSFDGGFNTVAQLPTPGPPLDGEIGLRTTNTSATFDSITVIESPP